MRNTALAIVFATLYGCGARVERDAPSLIQRGTAPDAPYVVHVWVDPAWNDMDRADIELALDRMCCLGARFVVEPVLGPNMVQVIPYTANTCYAWSEHADPCPWVFVDSSCAPRRSAFRATVAHHVLHVLGLRDIPVEQGHAVMNPVVGEAGGGAFTDEAPTALDAAAFARVMSFVR